MLSMVKRYLRIDGDQDDALLVPLIAAAKQYLLNAGVVEPEEPPSGNGEDGEPEDGEPEDGEPEDGEPEDGEGEDGEGEDGEPEPEPIPELDGPTALYRTAVCLYVNMLYNGLSDKALDAAMTAIILQIKKYGGEDDEI